MTLLAIGALVLLGVFMLVITIRAARRVQHHAPAGGPHDTPILYAGDVHADAGPDCVSGDGSGACDGGGGGGGGGE